MSIFQGPIFCEGSQCPKRYIHYLVFGFLVFGFLLGCLLALLARYMDLLTRYMDLLTRYMGIPLALARARGRARARPRANGIPIHLVNKPIYRVIDPYIWPIGPIGEKQKPKTKNQKTKNQIMDLVIFALGTFLKIWTLENRHVLGYVFVVGLVLGHMGPWGTI